MQFVIGLFNSLRISLSKDTDCEHGGRGSIPEGGICMNLFCITLGRDLRLAHPPVIMTTESY
jgi:hypothetical protein